MYEEYMQNYFGYPQNGYQNTYDQMMENYPYGYSNPNGYGCYTYNQSRNLTNYDIENYYPDIYKIIYPMIQNVCIKNSFKAITSEVIESMVDEVYNNIETNERIELNINLKNETRNNDVIGQDSTENREGMENRGSHRNKLLNDLIRILILRELIGKPGCCGQNIRSIRPTRPMPWQRGF